MNCPKCDRDISDSYEPDDPSVGIVGGWSCEDCDEGFAEWEYGDEPPDDDVSFSSTNRPPAPPSAGQGPAQAG